MLTACCWGQNLKAKEHFTQPNGLFTCFLLDTLENDEVDKNTTFEGVVEQVANKLRQWQELRASGAWRQKGYALLVL
jgi:hypothetical protein